MNITLDSIVNLDSKTLHQIADIKASIEAKQNELNALIEGSPTASNGVVNPNPRAPRVNGKRTFTPEQRAAISEGLKRKWAERRAESMTVVSATPIKPPSEINGNDGRLIATPIPTGPLVSPVETTA